MRAKKYELLIVLAGFAACSIAQTKQPKPFTQALIPIKGSQQLQEYASFYFDMADYASALPLYLKLDQRYPDRTDFIFRAGVCYLYKTGEKDQAITYLEKTLALDPKKEGLAFQLGRAYHINYRFDEALRNFNHVLNSENLSGADKVLVQKYIANCNTGKELAAKPLNVYIENIDAINSSATEYIPLLSSDEKTLVFTYKGAKSKGAVIDENGQGLFYDDVFISYKNENGWTEPIGLSDSVNTDDDEAAIAFSPDGTKVFIIRYNETTSGDIYMSEFVNNKWTKSAPLKGDVNSKYWEGSASISADGKTLYFDSERPGGLGGTDIYKSTMVNGSWGTAQNLGPGINTSFNEESPFFQSGNQTLYFSSEGHTNMGGFDIFKSKTEKDGAWSQPENLGFPINTTDNDKYFVVSKDGKRGYYHGIRPGGYGNQDIYIVHFDKPAPVAAAKTVFGQEKAEIITTENKTKSSQVKPTSKETAKSHELVTVTGNLLTVGLLNQPLSKVKVKLTNESKELIGETTSDNKGNFNFEGVPGLRNYNLQLEINESELPYKTEPALKPVPDNSEAGKKPYPKGVTVQKNAGTETGLSIMKAAVCRKVLNLEPVEEGDKFPESAGKLCYYTRVNAGDGEEVLISHLWYFNGNEVSRIALKARGTGWRTYSSKTIWPGMAGDWKVEAITAEGKVLNSVVFKIER